MTDQGEVALRDRRECGRPVGAPCRRDGRDRTAGHRGRAPVSGDREIAAHSRQAADAARPGSEFLSEVRAGRARDRRLGARHDRGERARQAADGFRAGAVPGKPRSARAHRRSRGGAHPGAQRRRHPHRDQRPDPGLGRRRARDGHRGRHRQFLHRLRLHRRHRGVGRRGPRDGELDRARRSRHGSVAVRSAPLRPHAQRPCLPARRRDRSLRALLRDRLAGRRARSLPPAAPLAAARDACQQWRRARPEIRLRAAELFPQERRRASFDRELPARGVRAGGRARAQGDPRGRRADRHVVVLEIRDHRARARCAPCNGSRPATSTRARAPSSTPSFSTPRAASRPTSPSCSRPKAPSMW